MKPKIIGHFLLAITAFFHKKKWRVKPSKLILKENARNGR